MMKAVAFTKSLPISDPQSLQDIELPIPLVSGRDVLVSVEAISVNPIDSKVRLRALPEEGEPKVVGFDAIGTVVEAGPECELFKKGDRVFYAGDVGRAGSNAEYQLVDERIAGFAPKSIDNAQAVAMPLTAITAYEMLFDRLSIQHKAPFITQEPILLITGAAGGVGSAMIQLAKIQCPNALVIATASRPESQAWCLEMGADHVINHHQGIQSELARIGIADVSHIASLTHTADHYPDFVEVIQPQGKICLIDDPAKPLDIQPLKMKSVSLHWELMFTRPRFQTEDMIRQHHILNEIALWLDDGRLVSTQRQHLGSINAGHLKQAHSLIESNTVIGKIVLEGF